MFEVYLVGNNSHHFIISPTSVQGKADIRIRVAIPLDYETVDRYDFDVSLLQHLLSGHPGRLKGRLKRVELAFPWGSVPGKPQRWQGLNPQAGRGCA